MKHIALPFFLILLSQLITQKALAHFGNDSSNDQAFDGYKPNGGYDADDEAESLETSYFEGVLERTNHLLDSEQIIQPHIKWVDLANTIDPEKAISRVIDQFILDSKEENIQITIEVKEEDYKRISFDILHKYLPNLSVTTRRLPKVLRKIPSQYVNVLINVVNHALFEQRSQQRMAANYLFIDDAKSKIDLSLLHYLVGKSYVTDSMFPSGFDGSPGQMQIHVVDIKSLNKSRAVPELLKKFRTVMNEPTNNTEFDPAAGTSGRYVGVRRTTDFQVVVIKLNTRSAFNFGDLMSGSDLNVFPFLMNFKMRQHVISPNGKELYMMVENDHRNLLDLHLIPGDRTEEETKVFLRDRYFNFYKECLVMTGRGSHGGGPNTLISRFPSWIKDKEIDSLISSAPLVSSGVFEGSTYNVKFRPIHQIPISSDRDPEIRKVIHALVTADRDGNDRVEILYDHSKSLQEIQILNSSIESSILKTLIPNRFKDSFFNKAIGFTFTGQSLQILLEDTSKGVRNWRKGSFWTTIPNPNRNGPLKPQEGWLRLLPRYFSKI